MPFIFEKERDLLYKDGLEKGIEKIAIEVIVKSTGLSKEEVEKLR